MKQILIKILRFIFLIFIFEKIFDFVSRWFSRINTKQTSVERKERLHRLWRKILRWIILAWVLGNGLMLLLRWWSVEFAFFYLLGCISVITILYFKFYIPRFKIHEGDY
jgi:hypothetical protein